MNETQTILKVATFAAVAHIKQKRRYDGSPYINHLLRVGETASRAGLSVDVISAGILHDVVEDTDTSFEDLTLFSERTVSLVRLLTKWWPEDSPKEDVEKNKVEYYRRILEDQDAIELKLLDRADNISDAVGVASTSRGWAQSYLKETENEFPALEKRSQNPIILQIYRSAVASLKKALEQT